MKTTKNLLLAGLLISVFGITACSTERPQYEYGYNDGMDFTTVNSSFNLSNPLSESNDTVTTKSKNDTIVKDKTPEIVMSDSISR